MRSIWFCRLAYYNQFWQEIDEYWEFVGYSEFGSDGVPRIIELRRKDTRQ